MDIAVIGTGYVGLTAAVCFAELGHRVMGVDRDKIKIDRIKKHDLPIYEPELPELFQRHLGSRLNFSTNLKEAVAASEILVVAVGTPQGPDGMADLSALIEVMAELGRVMNGYKIVINKSTVPVGTGKLAASIIKANQSSPIPFDMASNPEFLRQGSAVRDFLYPDRIVIGTEDPQVATVISQLYRNIAAPIVKTDIRTAELIKYASNGFLASKISFINELARLAELMEVDITKVAEGMGLDTRIGEKFLNAGIGFGGSCFPKDVLALTTMGKQAGSELSILEAVLNVNKSQRSWFYHKIQKHLAPLKGKQIGVLGLSFKPDTDDMREAPAWDIIKWLLNDGAKVLAYDPVAIPTAKKALPKVIFTENPYQVAEKSDAVVILTEWADFRKLNWKLMKDIMAGNLIFDGRNMLNASQLINYGFKYQGIGRKGI